MIGKYHLSGNKVAEPRPLLFQNGTPEMISTIPEYDQTETGDSLVYYSSRCSVSVAVEDLGEGTHSFQGYIYPDVTGGEDLVDAITPNTTVNLCEYVRKLTR